MEKSVTRDEMLKAEILWALKAIMFHYSYKSCEGTSKFFQAMFPDSRIASQFSCGEKKCAYLICFGLAPHFKQFLKDVVKKEEAYVLLFDESLNSVCQSKQMDIHIRSWNHDKHQAPVVQRVDSAIQWINYYPLDNAINFDSTYPVDSDLSNG